MVRVVRQLIGSVDGLALEKYRARQTYELDPVLADFLVLESYAISEMRRADRRLHWHAQRTDRRQSGAHFI